MTTRLGKVFLIILFFFLIGFMLAFFYVRLMNNDKPVDNSQEVYHHPQTNESLYLSPTLPSSGDSSKVYENTKFGFSIKYPAYLSLFVTSTNQSDSLDSGTVVLPLQKVSFKNDLGDEVFYLSIFEPRSDEISADSYTSGYLSLGSECDTRWIDSYKEVRLFVKGNIKVLKVKALREQKNIACFYFKNLNNNVLVFNILQSKEEDFNKIVDLVENGIISSLEVF